MICAKLDSTLCALAQINKATYTRYADDITFSTTKRTFPKPIADRDPLTDQIVVGTELNSSIESNGFRVNQSKVRLRTYDQRQIVTGLKVNERPNVNKKLLNQVRAMLNSWKGEGLAEAEEKFRSKWDRKARRKPDPDFKKVVKGKIDFIGFVKGRDSSAYAKSYWKYCELDRKFRFRTITASNDASDIVIRECLWVLESEYGERKQGTGVYIKGLGIVTCCHVLEQSTLAYHWRTPERKVAFEEVWKNEELDLAILSIALKPRAELGVERATSFAIGEHVTLYGFPT